jgi:presenilin-like A22 family membrane protease
MVFTKQIGKQEFIALLIMGLFFLIVYSLALFLVQPFETSEVIKPAFENPDDPINIIYIFTIMLIFTLLILLIAKFWKKQVIQIIILGAIGYTAFYAFFLPSFSLLFPSLNFTIHFLMALIAGVILVLFLFRYPEWYVIDICGIIVGTSAIIIFGISLNVLLILFLLICLALYDAISVYKTKHMIDLADTVMDLKLPVLLVVPKVRHYSLINETKRLKEKLKDGEDREAFFIGLGDIVMPGILIESIYYSDPNGLLVAIGSIIGTLIGFFVLMRFVLTGRPQAGLPLLCGGAIIGYLITSFLLYGSLIGITLPI